MRISLSFSLFPLLVLLLAFAIPSIMYAQPFGTGYDGNAGMYLDSYEINGNLVHEYANGVYDDFGNEVDLSTGEPVADGGADNGGLQDEISNGGTGSMQWCFDYWQRWGTAHPACTGVGSTEEGGLDEMLMQILMQILQQIIEQVLQGIFGGGGAAPIEDYPVTADCLGELQTVQARLINNQDPGTVSAQCLDEVCSVISAADCEILRGTVGDDTDDTDDTDNTDDTDDTDDTDNTDDTDDTDNTDNTDDNGGNDNGGNDNGGNDNGGNDNGGNDNGGNDNGGNDNGGNDNGGNDNGGNDNGGNDNGGNDNGGNDNGANASTYYDDDGQGDFSKNDNTKNNNGNTNNTNQNSGTESENYGANNTNGGDYNITYDDVNNYTDAGVNAALSEFTDSMNSFAGNNNTFSTNFDPATPANTTVDVRQALAEMTKDEFVEYIKNKIIAAGFDISSLDGIEAYHSVTGDIVVVNPDGRTGTLIRPNGTTEQITEEQLKYIRWAASLAGGNWRPIDEQFSPEEYRLAGLLALNSHLTYQEALESGELDEKKPNIFQRFVRFLTRTVVGRDGNSFNTPTQMVTSLGTDFAGQFSIAEKPRSSYQGAGIPEPVLQNNQTIVSENCLRGIEIRAVGSNATGLISLECQRELQLFLNANQQIRAAEDPAYYGQLLILLEQQQEIYNQQQQSGAAKTNYVDRTCFQQLQYGQLDLICTQQMLQLLAANNPDYFTTQMKIVDELVRTGGISAGTEVNTSVQSDLTVSATKAEHVTDNEYRLRGFFSRILENSADNNAFTEIGSYFGSNVTHRLLLDYECDGTADIEQVFTTPYYSILPRANGADVLLSEYVNVPRAGLHCFAFEVDLNDDIPETNEDNNLSNWREFITGFGSSENIELEDDGMPPLSFEISAYTSDGLITTDWTSEDIKIAAGQQIAFRWNAPQYQSCFPLLSSLTPDVASNLSPVDRNTIDEHINLHEHTGYYEVRCVLDDQVKVETIHLTVE